MKTTGVAGSFMIGKGPAGLRSLALLVLSALLVSAFLPSASAAASGGWPTRQLTDNAYDDKDPQISGDRVVWSGRAGSDREVFMWAPGEIAPTQLTDNAHYDVYPQISGDRVVWYGSDGNDDEIFTWSVGDSAPTTLTNNAYEEYGPRISGDRVVWIGWDSNDREIFTWSVGDSAPTQLTSNAYHDYHPQVSGDRVVWYGSDGNDYEIFTWSVGDSAPTTLTDNAYDEYGPRISGDRVVWLGSDGNDYEIFTWKVGDSAPTTLTDNAYEEYNPQISGDRIVWSGYDGPDGEIFTWTVGDSAPTKLTDDAYYDYRPRISGDRVVWECNDGNDYEIFTWKVGDSAPTQLTFNAYDDDCPEISGGRIVWRGGDGNDTEVFLVADAVTYTPIQGDTRFETAVAASQEGYPAGAPCVVVATGRDWPDALGGAALAGAKGGPILLVDSDTVPSAVAAEVTRLGASEAVVLGGEGAVGPAVFAALEELVGAGNVTRIGGANRYETAQMIADQVVAINGATTGFVATGADFPDALAAAPIAAAKGWPIYLAGSGTPDAMAADGMTHAILLGGPGVVSWEMEGSLKVALGLGGVQRLWGNDRYQTAIAVSIYGRDYCGLGWNGVALAMGTDFPDALAGGALQGADNYVMFLTPPNTLNADVAEQLAAEADVIFEVRYLGGPGAISQSVRDAVGAILD